jgi:hypothetical protein
LVYETDENGEMPGDFDLGLYVDGIIKRTHLKDSFLLNDEKFSYDISGKKYGMKRIILDKNGVYRISSSKKFAAYSYGYHYCDSYGFPAFAVMKDFSIYDSIPPDVIFYKGSYGESKEPVTSGIANDMPDDSAKRSNLSMYLYHGSNSFNYEFKADEIIPGMTRQINWELNVVDKSKNALAFVTFADRSGNDTTIYVWYNIENLGTEDNGCVIKNGFESKHYIISDNIEIIFNSPQICFTEISLIDASGGMVKKLFSNEAKMGENRFIFNSKEFSQGIYFLILQNGIYKNFATLKIVR